MKPHLKHALLILKYFTIPTLLFCNVTAVAIIQHFDSLESSLLYWCIVLWVAVEVCAITSFYTSLASFFATKADEAIGATYMAVLWTSQSNVQI